MTDPVNNFQIPDEWVKKAGIPPDELAEGIYSGRFISCQMVHFSRCCRKRKSFCDKDPDDHVSDATVDWKFFQLKENDEVVIIAGRGIGKKKGNPDSHPMRQIEEAVKEAITKTETGLKGAYVTI